MPASYRDVLDLFDAQKATNNYQSLPEFAQSLNDLTGTNHFDAGLKDSWVKRASVGIDRAVESTGAPEVLGDFFGSIGEGIGMGDTGREAGKGLARGIVNFLPLIAAAPFTGGGSVAAGLLGAGATALSAGLTGADAYTSTGSAGAGLVSAAALPIAGLASKVGGQLALKMIGAPLLEGVAKTGAQMAADGVLPMFTKEIAEGVSQAGGRVAETLGQRAASYLGGQVAALGTFEAANELNSVSLGEGLYNPVSPEKLFGTLIGQLPFAALDIPRVSRATPPVEELRRFVTTEAKNTDAKKGIDSIPIVTEKPAVDAVKTAVQLKELLKKKKEVKDDENLTDEEKAQKDAEIEKSVADLLGEGKVAEVKQQASDLVDNLIDPDQFKIKYTIIDDLINPTLDPVVDRKLYDLGYSVADREIMSPEQAIDILANSRKKNEVIATDEAAPSNIVGFTTEKGSTYELHDDGTTTRNKAPRPEHPGDEGPQPRSQATFYVTPEDATKLGEVQAEGGPKTTLRQLPDGRWGMYYLEGKDQGKFEERTVVEVSKEPKAGLVPVEMWTDANQPHFGNKITDVKIDATLTKIRTKQKELAKVEAEATALAKRVAEVPPPENLAEAVVQLQQLTKDAEAANSTEISGETLQETAESLVEDAKDGDDLAKKTIVVAKGKVSRAASQKAATAARNAKATERYIARKEELYHREMLIGTQHPMAKEYAEDIKVFRDFLRNNIEKLGEGRETGDEDLSRGMIHAYFNWDAKGREGGQAKLQSLFGKTLTHLMREGSKGTDVIKDDGSISGSADKNNMKFADYDVAAKYAQDHGHEGFEPGKRKNDKGTKLWYVLERKKRAPKQTALNTDEGQQKREVSVIVGGKEGDAGDMFAQSDEGTENKNDAEEVRPLIDHVNEVAGEADKSGATKEVQDMLHNAIKGLDDDVVGAYLEEETPEAIGAVRDRMAAIFQLQMKFGPKAIKDKTSLREVNKSLGANRFESHAEMLDFHKSDMAQELLREAARAIRDTSNVLKSPLPDGEYKGHKEITPEQKAISDEAGLESGTILKPLEYVSSKGGVYGRVADYLLNNFRQYAETTKVVNRSVNDGDVADRALYDPNTGSILLGRGILPNNPSFHEFEYMNHAIVHEFVHRITHEELRKNPIERANIDTLRQKAIDALPKDIRAILQDAIDKGRMEAYAKDDKVKVFIFGTEKQQEWYHTLYALINTDEFISQAFTSAHTQNYLSSLSGRKGNVFEMFKGFVRKALGIPETDTLLDDVISATDRLLNPDIRSPLGSADLIAGMAYKFGLTPKEVTERTRTISGLMATIRNTTARTKIDGKYLDSIGKQIGDAFLAAHKNNELGVDETKAINTAEFWYRNLDSTNARLLNKLFESKEGRLPESVSDILHNVSRALLDKEDTKAIVANLIYVDSPLLDAISVMRRYSQVTGSVASDLINAAAKGLVKEDFMSPGNKALVSMYENSQVLMRAEKKLRRAQSRFDQINTVTPVGLFTAQQAASFDRAPAPAPVESNLSDVVPELREELGITKPGIVTKTFMPIAQLAEKFPVIKEAIYKVFKHQGDVREATRLALLPFAGSVDKEGNVVLDKGSLQQAYEVSQSPVMNKAVSDIRRLMNEKKVMFDEGDAQFEKILNSLGTGQRSKVSQVVNQMTKSMKVVQDTIIARQTEMGEVSLGMIIQQRNPTLRSSQSLQLAQTLSESLRLMGDQTQPEKVVQGQGLLQSVQQRMSPELFKEALEYAVGDQQRVKELGDFYRGRPWFSSEQRFKRFLLRMVNADGETYTVDYDTEQEALRNKRRLNEAGFKYNDLIDRKGNDNHPSFSSDGMIDKVKEINTTRLNQLKAKLDPEVYDSLKGLLNIDEDLKRAQVARGLVDKGSRRTMTDKGREELDMIAGHSDYISRAINSQTAKTTRAHMELALMDPEVKAQPELAKLPRQHMENYFYPDTEAGKALTKANFLYYLGLNISTSMMEMGQSAFSLIPTLINEGMSLPAAYRQVIRTAKQITKYHVNDAWDNPEHKMLMDRTSARGELGLGSFSEVLDDSSQVSLMLGQLGTQQAATSVGKLVNKPLAMLSNLATGFYSKFTHFNSRMALVSSFDYFRSQGQTFEEALGNAERINNIANFAGGRASRAAGLYSNLTPAGRTASMALGSLQSYTMGMISMMGRYISRSYGADSKGLTSEQRSNARRATIVMMGTQLAAAGALGMPGVGAAIALLEQMFPDLELNKAIRTNLAKLGGDDKELGAMISDMALKGVVNQIGPVDVGSRFSLGNSVLGTSSYDGFSVQNLLGPTYNLFKNIAVGVSAASQGDVSGAAQSILPPSYKKLIDLTSNGGQIRDKAGNMLLQPTFGEQFAMAIGFRPKRVADLQDAKRIESRAQQIERRETMQFNSQLADALQANDQSTVRSLLKNKSQEDDTFDPRSAVRAAATIVEQRQSPVDLRRTAHSSGASDILNSYQLGDQGPSEVQRLQVRKGIETSVGIPGLGVATPSEIRQAQLVDEYMRTKGMTRDQARAAVQKLTAPKPSLPSF